MRVQIMYRLYSLKAILIAAIILNGSQRSNAVKSKRKLINMCLTESFRYKCLSYILFYGNLEQVLAS